MNDTASSNKKTYFEFMRIFACGLVIFNHLPGYLLYMTASEGKQYIYMCLAMITKVNVPLFFMISGALLLGKDEKWTETFRKRFGRVLFLLLVFSFVLYSVVKIKNTISGVEYEYTFYKFIYGFLNNQMEGVMEILAYWYLYSYLGFLFCLPMLQRIARGFNRTEFYAILILHFVTASLLPLINVYLNMKGLPALTITGRFSVPLSAERAFFYPLIGYYLDNRVDINKVKMKHLLSLGAAAAAGIMLSNMCTYYDADVNGAYSQNYVMLFDYIISIAVFVIIKYTFIVAFPDFLNTGRIKRMICFAGSLTLGIYLLDPCLKIIMYNRYEMWAEQYLPTLLVSIGWILVSMVCGGLLTCILKKFPLMRKVL